MLTLDQNNIIKQEYVWLFNIDLRIKIRLWSSGKSRERIELESLDDATQSTGIRITSLAMIRYEAGSTGYDTLNGSSMASPHVAGLVALVKAYNPDFTPAELRAAVLNTGTKISSLSGAFQKGSVVNAANALKYIPKPIAPTVTVD